MTLLALSRPGHDSPSLLLRAEDRKGAAYTQDVRDILLDTLKIIPCLRLSTRQLLDFPSGHLQATPERDVLLLVKDVLQFQTQT